MPSSLKLFVAALASSVQGVLLLGHAVFELFCFIAVFLLKGSRYLICEFTLKMVLFICSILASKDVSTTMLQCKVLCRHVV